MDTKPTEAEQDAMLLARGLRIAVQALKRIAHDEVEYRRCVEVARESGAGVRCRGLGRMNQDKLGLAFSKASWLYEQSKQG